MIFFWCNSFWSLFHSTSRAFRTFITCLSWWSGVLWKDELCRTMLSRSDFLENLEKAKKQSNYTNKLLQQCKSWGGPVTTIEELLQITQSKPDKIEQIVRTEFSYYRDTHKSDVIANAHLFKLNKVTHEERLANLSILLSDKSTESTYVSLPSTQDALVLLSPQHILNMLKMTQFLS